MVASSGTGGKPSSITSSPIIQGTCPGEWKRIQVRASRVTSSIRRPSAPVTKRDSGQCESMMATPARCATSLALIMSRAPSRTIW